MGLAERLRTEMALYGLRPVDLSRRTGIDQGHISRILAGEHRPTPATITRIVLAIHRDYIEEETPKVAA